MFTIGISFGYHDSSVTILSENHIGGVYQEERFSRKSTIIDSRNALKYIYHHKITKESNSFHIMGYGIKATEDQRAI